MNIIISSGHGLHVAGARGIIDEVTEARKVTDRVASILRTLGVNVNIFHENETRNQRDNVNTIVQHHNRQDRDLDVSVHFNAFSPTDLPRGVEVLFRNETEKEFASCVSNAISVASGLNDRGAKQRADLGFLNNTNKPAILIEVCFVDSVKDVQLYNDCFENICKAIAKTLSNEGKPNQKWPISEESLMSMQLLGVINSPEYWRTITHIKYLDALLKNAASAGLLDSRIENGIDNISTALDVLIDASIIQSPEYWQNILTKNDVKYLDMLIINIANKCRIVLEKIIHAESNGEDLKGQTLVGNVIINRHNNVNFPNGIYNVVFQSGVNSQGVLVHQFTPVANGAYSAAVPSKSVKKAVSQVLDDVNKSKGALFFIANQAVKNSWHESSLKQLFSYGGHTFFTTLP